MNMLRTTITLREDVYDELRKLAMANRMSMSDVVNAKLSNMNFGLGEEEIERKVKSNRAVFEALAKKGKPGVDVISAVREMRDK